MSINNDKKLEWVLNKALWLYEKGKTPSEIFNIFPDYKNDLQEFFQVMKVLRKEGEKIVFPKEFLREILNKIPGTVTKFETGRYLYRGEITKGRPSIPQLIERINLIMKKVYLGIGVVILVILIIVGVFGQRQKVAVSPTEEESIVKEELFHQDEWVLEEMAQEAGLENLDQDLREIEINGEEVGLIENLESELSLELNNFSSDLNDLEEFENDASLDNLVIDLAAIE